MKVYIAGSSGFLGRHLADEFGVYQTCARECDLRLSQMAFNAVSRSGADTIINAAGTVGGIGLNSKFPAESFEDNLLIGVNLMRAYAYLAGRQKMTKFVQISTVCSYPELSGISGKVNFPTQENCFWDGRPEESNSAYGLAKRACIDFGQALVKQDSLSITFPVLANLYGPNDHYGSDDGHCIPGMVDKFFRAIDNNDKAVTLWGSGECSREFLFIEDAASAVKFLLHNYNSPEIINVSSGEEVKIKTLAEMVAMECGFKGPIKWDKSRPDGQRRRHWDTSRLAKLGWRAKVGLSEGIKKTVADYKAKYRAASPR